MNEVPPDQDEPGDIDDYYRRVSALDPSRPSEVVRRAVLGHAARLAAERAAKKDSTRRATPHPWWRLAMVGTLAAAALAGILIAPQFLTPRAPPIAAISPAPASRPDAGGTPTLRAPAAGRAPQTRADKMPPTRMSREVRKSAEYRVSAQNAPAASPSEAMASQAPRISSTDSADLSSSPSAATVPRAGPPADWAAALRRAAEIGDISGLQNSLDQHVDINARDANGRTALMLATLRGQLAAVDALLARGADPNAGDVRGTTPLQIAVAGDEEAIVVALKRAGAR